MRVRTLLASTRTLLVNAALTARGPSPHPHELSASVKLLVICTTTTMCVSVCVCACVLAHVCCLEANKEHDVMRVSIEGILICCTVYCVALSP